MNYRYLLDYKKRKSAERMKKYETAIVEIKNKSGMFLTNLKRSHII